MINLTWCHLPASHSHIKYPVSVNVLIRLPWTPPTKALQSGFVFGSVDVDGWVVQNIHNLQTVQLHQCGEWESINFLMWSALIKFPNLRLEIGSNRAGGLLRAGVTIYAFQVLWNMMITAPLWITSGKVITRLSDLLFLINSVNILPIMLCWSRAGEEEQ